MTEAPMTLARADATVTPPIRRVRMWRALLASPEGRVGAIVGFAIIFVIAFGRFIAPYSPTKLSVGPVAQGPTWAHLLGTDTFGRDVLSRFLTGGGSILVVPFISVAIAYLIAGTLGMIGAYTRGWQDALITRAFDLLLTLPPLLIVLVIVSGAGTSTLIIIAATALVNIPRVGRVIRGATQAVVTSDYVASAQARGERVVPLLMREVLPNISAPVIADFALRFTYAVIFISTLNYLGIGAQPPSPAWGLSVSEERTLLHLQPLACLAPAAGIALLAIAFSLSGDALTRYLARESQSMAYR